MSNRRNNILITGPPGIGKTSLIIRLAGLLHHLYPTGFYTKEIREKNIRKGFELVSFDGRKQILSHTIIKSQYRVGKYGVDVAGFDNFLEDCDFHNMSSGLIIIDEIGKMECFSDKFKKIITMLLDSEITLLATIALKGGGIIEAIKRRSDYWLYEINRSNRDLLAGEIAEYLLEK